MPNNATFAGWRRGTGDETHSSTGDVLEILVPGEGSGTYSRQVHIAQAGDHNTDWGIAAQTNPMLVIHAACSPACNYTTIDWTGVQIGGNEVLTLTNVACAVNQVTITNAIACASPDIAGTGDSTNVGLTFDTKAAGQYIFQSGGVDLLNLHDAAAVSFVAATDTAGHTTFFQTEDGGLASSGTGGIGGTLQLLTGDGGAGIDTCNRAGGAGGAFTLVTGAGGAASACTTGTGGAGGLLCLAGGAGGVAASSCSGNAGAGGGITLTGGVAGAITGGTGTPGVGGAIILTGGIGSTSNVACDTSGAGGAITFASGAGGTGTGAGASGCGGAGGAYTISAGVGGASTSGGGGNGGDLELFSGQGGVGTGGSAGGCAGDIILHIGTAVEAGAVGNLFIRNNTTGAGLATAAVCSTTWTDINAGAGNVYTVTGWLATTAAPANVGVLVIETA